MKNRYYILILFILISSCEKSQDNSDNFIKFYGDVSEDIGYSIAKTDGGYFIGGQLTEITRTGGNFIEDKLSVKKMGIIKTDPNGIEIWQKTFGDSTSVGSKILVLDDGSVICTGSIIDKVALTKDIFVVKVNSDGSGFVQKIYKSDGNQSGTDIVRTSDGFMILAVTDVAGTQQSELTSNIAGKKDILIRKINNNLDLVLSPPQIGYPGNDEGIAIKSDISGGQIIVGTTDRNLPGQGGNNIFLLRVNVDGSVTAPRIIGGIDDEYAADIEVLSDGYLVPVTVGAEGTNQKGYILKLSSDIYATPTFGPYIKSGTSTTDLPCSLKAISKYKTNSFVVAGQTGSSSSAKMLIFAIDAEGNKVEGKEKIAGGTGNQVAYDVISDEKDNIIAVGKNSYESNSMITLFRFRF